MFFGRNFYISSQITSRELTFFKVLCFFVFTSDFMLILCIYYKIVHKVHILLLI